MVSRRHKAGYEFRILRLEPVTLENIVRGALGPQHDEVWSEMPTNFIKVDRFALLCDREHFQVPPLSDAAYGINQSTLQTTFRRLRTAPTA